MLGLHHAFGGGSNISNPPLTGVPYHNITLFQYTSFKLTDSISASIQLNYGKNNEENQANNGRQGNTTFQVDNAFLPANYPQPDDRQRHSQHHGGRLGHGQYAVPAR